MDVTDTNFELKNKLNTINISLNQPDLNDSQD